MAKFIFPSVKILTDIDEQQIYKTIETMGRVCYKSEYKIGEGSAESFVKNIMKRGHESVIEHVNLSVNFITDRAVTHELVRHRLASYSQVSQRYCNYADDKFGKELTFVIPKKLMSSYNSYIGAFNYPSWNHLPYNEQYDLKYWMSTCDDLERIYLNLISFDWSPQDARSILPNCTQTEINVTTNLREWRHILKLRTSEAAHPDMRYVMKMLENELKLKLSLIF